MQDYAKTTEWISTKLSGRMGRGPRRNPVDLGADQDKGAYPGKCFFSIIISIFSIAIYTFTPATSGFFFGLHTKLQITASLNTLDGWNFCYMGANLITVIKSDCYTSNGYRSDSKVLKCLERHENEIDVNTTRLLPEWKTALWVSMRAGNFWSSEPEKAGGTAVLPPLAALAAGYGEKVYVQGITWGSWYFTRRVCVWEVKEQLQLTFNKSNIF